MRATFGYTEMRAPMTPEQAELVENTLRLLTEATADASAFAGAASNDEMRQMRCDGYAFVSGVRAAIDLVREAGGPRSPWGVTIQPPSLDQAGIWHRDGVETWFTIQVALTDVDRDQATTLIPRLRGARNYKAGVPLAMPLGGVVVFDPQLEHRRGFDKWLRRWVLFVAYGRGGASGERYKGVIATQRKVRSRASRP